MGGLQYPPIGQASARGEGVEEPARHMYPGVQRVQTKDPSVCECV